MISLQNIRQLFKLQKFRSASSLRQNFSDVSPTGDNVSPAPSTEASPDSLYQTKRHVTPASDLSTLYKQPYNETLRQIYGDVKNSNAAQEKVYFEDFKGLNPKLLKTLADLGYEKPLPVQTQTLSVTLKGRDAVIKSVTGSGKTLAFVLPMMNRIGYQFAGSKGVSPQAIIVAPTRELVRQISSVVAAFAGEERVMNMTGGNLKVRGQAKIARAGNKDIVVATPGRVMQLVSMNIIRPGDLKFLVLDEADELLHDVFYEQMRWILDNATTNKQMVVTTATVPPRVQFIIDRYMKYHDYIDIGDANVSFPAQVKHKAVLYDTGVFVRALKWVLKAEHRTCSMVFVKYRPECSKITEIVRSFGYTVKYINSEVPEKNRIKVMEQFRNGEFEILVATDLAARGVDVPQCELVVHLKPDLDHTKYVHRAGRTGRQGRAGTSVLMLTNKHQEQMEFLEELSELAPFEYYMYSKNKQYRLVPKN